MFAERRIARIGRASVGVDDQRVLRQERGGDAHRDVQQAARVAAQVENQAREIALLVEVADRLRHVLAGVLLELDHAQVAVTRLDQLGPDAAEVDDLARQREGQRRVDVLARDRQHDLGAGLAAHLLDGLGERESARDGVIDLDDQVARLHAGAERGRVLDRRNDFDDAVFDADLDAEAAELALGRDLQLLERIGVEEVGMRVEAVHHAVDGLVDELVVRYRLDIVALDASEHGGEQLQVLVGDRQTRVALGQRREIEAQQQPEDRAQADPSCFLPTFAHL